ncbi:MAG TPA: Ppx/GppA phosphatase family protein [Thermoplasmata archaeon]|nr:Ppx/GppA phosphatase family protein [Thermoplasmata archaeon]
MDRSRGAQIARAGPAERSGLRRRLGVIDVGSNTARFVAFEASASGCVRPFYETKEAPRLGLNVRADGRLAPDAIERGIAAVEKFARTIRGLGLSQTLAVATSAVRDAPNGAEFVRQVERATGVLLRVISGAEEARYAYLGVASAWELDRDLVSDLGGGSLQLAETVHGRLGHSVSVPLGALRLSQRYFDHDPPKRKEVDELRAHVRETLGSVFEAFGNHRYRVYGIGGTVRALARAAIEIREYPIERVHGYPLWDHDLESLAELLGEMPAAKRRSVPGIGADRADVVIAGLVVLRELVRATEADRITVAGIGIREGIALEAIGAPLPASAEVLAERSAAAAAESFAFAIDHGRAVAETAMALFALLAPRFEWGKGEGLALRVAGWMHDAGTAIDLWRHANHSAYLIQNYPIWGLDQREVLLASMAARTHEGGDLPSDWKKGFLPILRGPDLETARRLGAVLEVAELTSPGRPRFTANGGATTVTLTFSPPSRSALDDQWEEKVRKTMARILDTEVRVRDA